VGLGWAGLGANMWIIFSERRANKRASIVVSEASEGNGDGRIRLRLAGTPMARQICNREFIDHVVVVGGSSPIATGSESQGASESSSMSPGAHKKVWSVSISFFPFLPHSKGSSAASELTPSLPPTLASRAFGQSHIFPFLPSSPFSLPLSHACAEI